MKLKDININLVSVVAVIVFIITTTISMTTVYSVMREDVNRVSTGFNHLSVMMNDHETRIKNIEESNQVIMTDLNWIKATLLEIKQDIKGN